MRLVALLGLLLACMTASAQADTELRGLEPLRLAIDQRLLLAPAVARAKWNVQAPIEDSGREAQVIQTAVKEGSGLGLSSAWVETVFRAQIEASKTVQRELFVQWRAQQAGKFDDAPDLAKTIRPELDRLTTQLLRSMADNQALLNDEARKDDVTRFMGSLEARALSPHAVMQALAPFSTLAPAEPVPQVAVAGTKDPDWKPYRKMLDGLNAFDQYHALAPKAELKFILRPQQPNLTLADLKLRIVGDSTNIELPIAADSTFSVPRDESAAKDDADLRLNSKKGLFRWRPDIHTAGLPAGTRRLGDLRLECEVRWAVDKFDASFIKLAYIVPLGGVCHSSRSRVFFTTATPIAGATLVSGTRREKLPAERLNATDRTRYAPPLHDQSWPDDTLVEFDF
ncbi:gamma subclass chorismate mutase AroQ [Duganella sp. BJB475]|nr:gamma subclass chorismate mutase AroQ [Duganella sp. BJB475]